MIERLSLDKLQKLIDYYGLRSKTAYTSTNATKTATQINTSLHISSSWDSIYLGGCTFAIYTPGGTETICRVSAHSDADVGKLYCEIPILPSAPRSMTIAPITSTAELVANLYCWLKVIMMDI